MPKDRVIWIKTKYTGLRYKEHPSRKHNKKPDRYYVLNYKHNGKNINEAFGWISEKGMTEKQMDRIASELRKARTTGEGPRTLKEKQKLEDEMKAAKELEEKRLLEEQMTFADYFNKKYCPVASLDKKPESHIKSVQHFNKWLNPVIGEIALKDVCPMDIERVKKKLVAKKMSPRSIEYVLATFRQVWNMARRDEIVYKDSPSKKVKIPKKDNRRQKYLKYSESEKLLKELEKSNLDVCRMTLLSLDTGMRAKEIFSLKWGQVNTDAHTIHIRDPKNTRSRYAFMTTELSEMFSDMTKGGHDELVFSNKEGEPYKEIPSAFRTAVKHLGLNEGVEDRRDRVVFHTLRHTYASRLVANGTDLYTVKELMGHCALSVTERYSHLGKNTLQDAVSRLDESLKQHAEKADNENKGEIKLA